MTRLHDALRELSATWVSLGLDPLPHIDDGLELLREVVDVEEAAGTELEVILAATFGYYDYLYPFSGECNGAVFTKQINREVPGADWSAVSATNFVHRLVAGHRVISAPDA